MWNRGELKERAKQTLRKYYWMAFLVTFLASLLVGGLGAGAPTLGYRFELGGQSYGYHNYNYFHGFRGGFLDRDFIPWIAGALAAMAVLLTAVALIAAAVGIAYGVFVAGPLEVGKRRYFLEARQDRSEAANLLYSFGRGRYPNAVKAMAWRLLFLFLWTLLFIIPGIVKAYSYGMIPYLMADNPKMDYGRAMKLSMAMTRGRKWSIFVLDLSFLGWALLGMLCCGVGVLFLSPYFYATKAEMYVALRARALDEGLCQAAELGLEPALEA
jgi:uncharacterized membrane protein